MSSNLTECYVIKHLSQGNVEIEDRLESPAQKSVDEELKEERPEEAAPNQRKRQRLKPLCQNL